MTGDGFAHHCCVITLDGMTTWFKKELGDAVMAAPALETLKEQFAALDLVAGNNGPAVFVHTASGDLHCEVTVYFSPAAAALATSINAEPCTMPVVNGLTLLAGHPPR